ncbi:photosystem II cytochrome c-550 [Oscillatoria sp. FACHB-1406]|uniref:photosystem II cytochrome c-550 n=1 Tax=Oscillatoria sp. FACHB-1406 TaxID=2692846 RepID=UPI00168714CD|nr:photosystem II cytochrome c-550 [Oscillatoria sp. FACHB-1406]MBD2579152.1 cytochrome c-550 [Oscillatoria sp. FACHB-1406]
MLKRLFLGLVATLIFTLQLPIDRAFAVDIKQELRTVKQDATENVVVSNKEFEHGKRLFTNACSKCHMAGRTKTNPNVTLGSTSLKGAEPPRDNVDEIVSYLNNPKTYDGEQDISELHPNTTRTDLYPEMRNLTQQDLQDLAGYILTEAQIRGFRWGAGKVYD